jgi:two-component system sensor histidine kinase RegB
MYSLDNLVDNAVDYASARVTVVARWTRDHVRLEIRDDGPGFDPDVLLRVGEPYVTTRGPDRRGPGGDAEDYEGGGGLGLGLFIAKTLIERSGGQLTLVNATEPETGAVARIVWARAAFERGATRYPPAGAPAPMTSGQTLPI